MHSEQSTPQAGACNQGCRKAAANTAHPAHAAGRQEEGFQAFSFHPKLRAAIQRSGYATPTPIQQQAIPPILADRDMLGLAQTGTGKTAAFVLPVLQRLLTGPRKKTRALVVAPTRELAEQIHEYVGKMAKGTGLRSAVVYGGVGKQGQVTRIRQGAEIIVACPGRLLDHLRDRAFNLSRVEMLVLDEADHMFDKGFLPDIRKILKYLPQKRQTLVFSATMPAEIRRLTEEILREPKTVQINYTKPTTSVSHRLFAVEQPAKTSLLKTILQQAGMETTLVFTRTKHKAKQLAQQLERAGFKATSLQGNLSQQKRRQALAGFKSGRFTILVATDIAARGIDVSGISHVINYDMPDTVETYTHRTGRTGRAACIGEAYTFAGRGDRRMVQSIERFLGKKMIRQDTPEPQDSAVATGREGLAPEPAQRSRPRRPAHTAGMAGRKRRRDSRFDFGVGGRSQRGGTKNRRQAAR